MSYFSRAYAHSIRFIASGWKKFRALPRYAQALGGLFVFGLVIGLLALIHGIGATDASETQLRAVTVSSVGELSGGESGVGVLGTVRSVTEANIVTQAGGTIRRVHATIGQSVPAGFVIAELDNSSESATVLQAEGAYEAALAARQSVIVQTGNTTAQSGNTVTSFAEAQTAARNTYRATYTSVDTTLQNNVDTLFGNNTAVGPELLINPNQTGDSLSRERRSIGELMDTWQQSLTTLNSTDPETLFANAQSYLTTISGFLTRLSAVANAQGSGATPAQLAALASARATIDANIAGISAGRDAYRAKRTGATVAGTQGSANSAQLASASASVKQALGTLRGAQALYEKTVVRASIGGTVNFLSIHAGDYVAPFTHVATVARNNALEVVAYVSQDTSTLVAVGDTVTIEGSLHGVVTSVAPALDPTTKQIELHIAVTEAATLVDGQSVHITLSQNVQKPQAAATTTPTVVLLPLAAVKLRANDRIVFTVDAAHILVAHTVTIGDVVGDRIQVTSSLPADLNIVTDARGLSEGQHVSIASSTPH